MNNTKQPEIGTLLRISLIRYKGEFKLPIYVYQCGDCLGEWKENHLMSETIEECTWCGSKNIGRKPSNFSYNGNKQKKRKKLVI